LSVKNELEENEGKGDRKKRNIERVNVSERRSNEWMKIGRNGRMDQTKLKKKN
jgi:hypothetical protein